MHPSKRSNLKSFVGDVRDYDRLEQAMNGVDYVYHCAALKHVKLCDTILLKLLKRMWREPITSSSIIKT